MPTPSRVRVSVSFNSRTLGRVRPSAGGASETTGRFNSRTLGRVRHISYFCTSLLIDVSIHAPWEGCDTCGGMFNSARFVSIHAPWEGCDYVGGGVDGQPTHVSIHAPWEGCDLMILLIASRNSGFNSRTLGRVRLLYIWIAQMRESFNSRTLGRVRHERASPQR